MAELSAEQKRERLLPITSGRQIAATLLPWIRSGYYSSKNMASYAAAADTDGTVADAVDYNERKLDAKFTKTRQDPDNQPKRNDP